tara:strand:+ start:40 stop:546 length:507 start_codon:yes stop_codon:yes gene_type:complete
MAISFLVSSDSTMDIYLSFDPSIELDEDQRKEYLNDGVFNGVASEEATIFKIKALSPSEREEAEVRAGSFTRSELGRMLWIESPSDDKRKAQWHHKLTDEEKHALSSYQSYLNKVYLEMIRASLISIDGEEATLENIQAIRPESHRIQAITELVLHIQRISLVGNEGK